MGGFDLYPVLSWCIETGCCTVSMCSGKHTALQAPLRLRSWEEGEASSCLQVLERGYGFLRMISRSPVYAFRIPAHRLLEVGLQYEV